MSLATSYVGCIPSITCVAFARLETALNVGCQLREDVESVSGLSTDQTMREMEGAVASCPRLAV